MYRYKMNEHGEYVLYDVDKDEIILMLTEVAICFTYDMNQDKNVRGTLLKHGSPTEVKEYLYGKKMVTIKNCCFQILNKSLNYNSS